MANATAAEFTVGLDVSALAGPRTGIARYTSELLRGLQAALPSESVIAIGHRPPSPVGDVRIRGPLFPSRGAWTFGVLPLWLNRPATGIDVFHATSYYAPLGSRVPAVVTIHDLSTFASPSLHPRSRVLRARLLMPVVARRAAAVIVPSRAVAGEVVARLGVPPELIHVVPEAPAEVFTRPVARADVDEVLARYGLEPGFSLAVGTLEPRKNLGRVVEAIGRLRCEPGHDTKLRLVVAGPSGWKFGREEAAGRAVDGVRFLGFVPDVDLRVLMAAARALVYPSLYEGFGLPVLEAMAAGLPVVTSGSGALAELAGDAALLVDPLDTDSIAAAMARLVVDPALGPRLAELGRTRAAAYSWERTARETLEVYRAALELSGSEVRRRMRPPISRPAVGLPAPSPAPIERGIVAALAYADVFDWPLTADEIRRYLPVTATRTQVEAALLAAETDRLIERHGDLVMLDGRGSLAAVRNERSARSASLWPTALAWARRVGRLPFVRMVAVTGSLAVDSARDRDDVDLLVVTAEGRLWLTRAMAMALVRLARLGGLRLCPNYLLAESALGLQDRSLFTARELVQMVPVTGGDAYADLMARNDWYREFLPNAEPRSVSAAPPRRLRRFAESVLRLGLFDRLERWEMNRKSRLLYAASASTETRYDATCCKGHAGEHGRQVLADFESRLARLEARRGAPLAR
jgi:glycosyltransferase involved in cell wall biosynthesis